MTVQTILLLLAAGFVGGLANAMAGGATLITFPAMMAAGLAPISANASNTVAVVFGNVMGAWAERKMLPAFSGQMWAAFGAAVLGGAAGAWMLLVTPEALFVKIVPALIGAATFIFAFGKPIQSWVSSRLSAEHGGNLRTALVFPATVYGGYFGAGLGVILLAVLNATSAWELRTTNAVKNLLGVTANAAAISIFLVQGIIQWPQTLVMMAACIVGGYVGGRALSLISAGTMRIAVIGIGVLMTLIYAGKYWAPLIFPAF